MANKGKIAKKRIFKYTDYADRWRGFKACLTILKRD